jgi:hypothetical protein
MTSELAKYETQINEIASFAKRINYNIDNGIDELLKLWFQDGKNFQDFAKDNKQEVKRAVKNFLN